MLRFSPIILINLFITFLKYRIFIGYMVRISVISFLYLHGILNKLFIRLLVIEYNLLNILLALIWLLLLLKLQRLYLHLRLL